MADPKTPDAIGDNDKFIRFTGCPCSPVPLAEIRDKLFRFYGLHIVSEADKRVLDACAALPEKQLQSSLLGKPFRASHLQRLFAEAELARRTP